MLDQALLPEQAQRLAQRRAADPEPARQLLLDQPLAGCEGTADDLPAQPADGQLDQALRLQDARLQLRCHGAPISGARPA